MKVHLARRLVPSVHETEHDADAQVRGISGVLSHLLETGTVNGQAALLPSGDLSPAATGVLEQARTAVVLAAHLMADKVGAPACVACLRFSNVWQLLVLLDVGPVRVFREDCRRHDRSLRGFR